MRSRPLAARRWTASPLGTIAETLGAAGWNTFAVGSWHVAPIARDGRAGPYTDWPTNRGFGRFYVGL